MSFLKTKFTSITKVFKHEKHTTTTYQDGSNRYQEENSANEMTATVYQVQDAPQEETVGHFTEDTQNTCNDSANDDPFSIFSTTSKPSSPSSQGNQQQRDNLGYVHNEASAQTKKGRRKSSSSDSSLEEVRTREIAPGISIPVESKKSRRRKRKTKMQRLEGIHRRTSQGLTPPSYFCSGCTLLAGLIMFISGMIMVILGLTVPYYQNTKAPGNFMRFGGGFFLMLGFLMLLIGGFYLLLVFFRHRGYFNKKDENKPPPAVEVAESVTSESESETEDNNITIVQDRKASNTGSTTVSMTSNDTTSNINRSPSDGEFSLAKDTKVYTSQRSGKLPPLSAPRPTLDHSSTRRPSMDMAGFRGSQRDGSSLMSLDKTQAVNQSGKRRASMVPLSSVSLTPRTLKKSSSAMEFELTNISGPRTPRSASNSNLHPTGSTASGLDNANALGRRSSVQMYIRNK